MNILIIIGHPNPDSLNHALAKAYQTGAESNGANVKVIEVGKLNFDPNLKYGYHKRMELEPDLVDAQEKIKWAVHIVLLYPLWWGSIPALLKGFFDRVLIPGFAFKYRENSVWWDKYLKGKSARVIATMDQPTWYYRCYYRRPSYYQIKKLTLEFCGIKPVKTTFIGNVKTGSPAKIQKQLKKTEALGKQLK